MKVVRKHDRDRPRGWFGLFFRLGGWVSLIAALVMMVMAGLMLGYSRSAMLFDRDGITAQADVLHKQLKISYDSDGDEQRTYLVRFFFDTATMETVDVQRSVSRRVYDAVHVGQPRDIRYLPYDPQRFEHTVGSNAANGRIARVVGWVVGALGLGTLWYFGMQTNRAVLTRREGEVVVGEVVEVRRLKVQVNHRQQARLHWRLPDGAEGRSLMRDANGLVMYAPGDRITVFRRGRDMWWEGDVGARSEGNWRLD
ncbi:MAG: hypothetical protein AAFY90_08635 [Pseudomonadota bacterium]